MTGRGKLVLLLGAAVYVLAWVLGSKALYPVAAGLVLAVLVTWVWMRLARRPLRLERRARRHEHYEGEDVEVDLRLELGPGLPAPGAVAVRERLSRLGERETVVRGSGRLLTAKYVLARVPRGRYVLEDAQAVLEDPFGLERREATLAAASTLLVYPRLVPLERLFSEASAAVPEGSRLLLRRPSGYDLHSVREHQQGESLRRVHWRSTAKVGRLMVKELEDAPRDEVAVVLDASAAGAKGRAFDVQVRAAGSILRAHAARKRRSVLLVNGSSAEAARTSGPEDWRRALDLLAAVEPAGHRPVEALLAHEGNLVARALELAVVTSVLPPQLVDRLIQRAATHRHVSLVYVDTASFAGATPVPQPGLLWLQAAGVPVALVRRGDNLAAVLAAPAAREAVHA